MGSDGRNQRCRHRSPCSGAIYGAYGYCRSCKIYINGSLPLNLLLLLSDVDRVGEEDAGVGYRHVEVAEQLHHHD